MVIRQQRTYMLESSPYNGSGAAHCAGNSATTKTTESARMSVDPRYLAAIRKMQRRARADRARIRVRLDVHGGAGQLCEK